MSIVSYAQNFEDVLLWRALGDVKDGRYIDIGAHDPVVDSVSQAFYEAGWRGMHVEPLPHYAAKLREARPEELVIEAAVTEAAGPMPFYELSGLSSGRADIARHHERSGHVTRKMLVPTVRLDDLLKLIGADIHWLKIDVEGMEADVLRSWGKSSVRPWVLVVEATFPNTQDPTQHLWLDEVLGRGYEQVFFDGLSCYFVHESHRDLAARFASPANFFDKFSVAKDHFSAALIKAELETSERLLVQERGRVDHLNTELRDLWQTHNGVREEQRRALEQLVAAERDHRAAVDAMLLGRRDLEQREEQLRQALREPTLPLVRRAWRLRGSKNGAGNFRTSSIGPTKRPARRSSGWANWNNGLPRIARHMNRPARSSNNSSLKWRESGIRQSASSSNRLRMIEPSSRKLVQPWSNRSQQSGERVIRRSVSLLKPGLPLPHSTRHGVARSLHGWGCCRVMV